MAEVLRKHDVKRVYIEQFRSLYIALEEMDFFWGRQQVWEFDRMWRKGWSIYYIAEHFDRDPDEVLVLYLDRIKKGYISNRKNGVIGWRGNGSDGRGSQ